MAVSNPTIVESHTGTTGHSGSGSFTWNVSGGTPRGMLVFVFTISATKTVTSVTYGGVALEEMVDLAVVDAATEPGRIDVFYLGEGVPTGTQAVVVNRTNNAVVMYGVAHHINAADDTEIYLPTAVLQQGDGTIAELSINDNSPGHNTMRFAAAYTGAASPATAGAASTLGGSIDFGAFGCSTARETTAGQGSRATGLVAGSDDRAYVVFAVREVVRGSVRFDGTNDRITFPDQAELDALDITEYLCLAWVLPEAGGHNNGRVFERGDTAAGTDSHMQLMLGNGTNGTRNGSFSGRQKHSTSAGTGASGVTVAPNGSWVVMGIHFDPALGATSKFRLFRNADLLTPLASETAPVGTPDTENDQAFWIGSNGANDRPFQGRVSSLGIWDVSGLSTTEVEQIATDFYNGGTGSVDVPRQDVLVEFLRLTSHELADLEGDKGVLVNGVAQNGAWAESGPPVTYNALSSSTPVSSTDSGTGSDAHTLTSTAPSTDTGTGTDTSTPVAALSGTDTGAGTDTNTVTVPIASSDSGGTTEGLAALYQIPSSEAGGGTETLTPAFPPFGSTDTGAGTDAVTATVPITFSESGAGTDATALSAILALTDSGSGGDALALAVQALVTESGAGTDLLSLSALILSTDSALASEVLTLIASLLFTDTGAGSDALTKTSDGSTFVNVSDSGTGTDAHALAAQLAGTESGAGTDALARIASLILTESGTGVEGISVIYPGISLTETGVGSDALTPTRVIVMTDTGAGADLQALQASLSSSDTGTSLATLLMGAVLISADAGTAVDIFALLPDNVVFGARVEVSEGGLTISALDSLSVTVEDRTGTVN